MTQCPATAQLARSAACYFQTSFRLENTFEVRANLSSPQGVRSVGRQMFENRNCECSSPSPKCNGPVWAKDGKAGSFAWLLASARRTLRSPILVSQSAPSLRLFASKNLLSKNVLCLLASFLQRHFGFVALKGYFRKVVSQNTPFLRRPSAKKWALGHRAQDSIQQAKNGRVRTDTQGQCHDDGRRCARASRKCGYRPAKIAP